MRYINPHFTYLLLQRMFFVVQRMQKTGHEYHNIRYTDTVNRDMVKTAAPLQSLPSDSSTSLQSVGVWTPCSSPAAVPTVPPIPDR